VEGSKNRLPAVSNVFDSCRKQGGGGKLRVQRSTTHYEYSRIAKPQPLLLLDPASLPFSSKVLATIYDIVLECLIAYNIYFGTRTPVIHTIFSIVDLVQGGVQVRVPKSYC
jgi:hypothetical protein